MTMNPYTHLRTLLDDESRHAELCGRLWSILNNKEYDQEVQGKGFPRVHYDFMKDCLTDYILIRVGRMGGHNAKVPIYTTSLDALLPLWPEAYLWEVCELPYRSNKEFLCGAQHKKEMWKLKSWAHRTPALAMLDCLLQVLEYEEKN